MELSQDWNSGVIPSKPSEFLSFLHWIKLQKVIIPHK